MYFPQRFGRKMGCILWSECSLPGSLGEGVAVERVFSSYFPLRKSRYVLWSSASYTPKNMVLVFCIIKKFKHLFLNILWYKKFYVTNDYKTQKQIQEILCTSNKFTIFTHHRRPRTLHHCQYQKHHLQFCYCFLEFYF